MKVSTLTLSLLSATVVNAQNYANPPYYPSPKGGWLSDWSASYDKARLLVSKMTLAGKVNITTATGWSMVRYSCAGGIRCRACLDQQAYIDLGALCRKYWACLWTFPIALRTGWASWCPLRRFDHSFSSRYHNWRDLGCRSYVRTRKRHGPRSPRKGCTCYFGTLSRASGKVPKRR